MCWKTLTSKRLKRMRLCYGVVEEYIGAPIRPRWAFFSLPYNTGLYALVIAGYATIKCGMKASCSSTEQRGVFAAMAIEAYCVKCKAKKEMKDPLRA